MQFQFFLPWGCSIHTGLFTLYNPLPGSLENKTMLTGPDNYRPYNLCSVVPKLSDNGFTFTFLPSIRFLPGSDYNNVNNNVHFHLLFHLHSVKVKHVPESGSVNYRHDK